MDKKCCNKKQVTVADIDKAEQRVAKQFSIKRKRAGHNKPALKTMYNFLGDIPEIRTRCGFRENMIREANKPFGAAELEWLG